MVRIPYIKIPSVRVGSIVPTSNIGTGTVAPIPPTPVTYLTQWKIVGNSEVHGQEIWSCGEYNPIDGKWHILVQPEGYGIVDIALDEPLRMVGNVADSIEFVNGVAVVTRNVGSVDMGDYEYLKSQTNVSDIYRYSATTNLINLKNVSSAKIANALCSKYRVVSANDTYTANEGVSINSVQIPKVAIYLEDYKDGSYKDTIKNILQGVEFIYELETPTTEVIQVPQIAEADSYTCVISQGGKAVSWSSFETNSE